MNHPHSDELVLFATGELAEPRVVELAAHLTACASCREALAQLDASLIALDAALPRRGAGRPVGGPVVWAGVALAAAAVVAVVLIRRPDHVRPAGNPWMPMTTWSATAGYMAGGKTLVDIDAQLTRLEQESSYGRP